MIEITDELLTPSEDTVNMLEKLFSDMYAENKPFREMATIIGTAMRSIYFEGYNNSMLEWYTISANDFKRGN